MYIDNNDDVLRNEVKDFVNHCWKYLIKKDYLMEMRMFLILNLLANVIINTVDKSSYEEVRSMVNSFFDRITAPENNGE